MLVAIFLEVIKKNISGTEIYIQIAKADWQGVAFV